MNRQTILAIVAVFIVWTVLDFLIHGVLLQPTYEATASLWRPMEEMKMVLMHLVTLMFTTGFVLIYSLLIKGNSVGTGIQYGILFGLAIGIPMGFGSYSYMPIPYMLAFTWFAGALIKTVIAGAMVGAIIKS